MKATCLSCPFIPGQALSSGSEWVPLLRAQGAAPEQVLAAPGGFSLGSEMGEKLMSVSLVTTSLQPSCLYFLLETLSTSCLFLQTPHVSKAKEKAALLSFFSGGVGLRCCPGLSPAVLKGCSGCGAQWLRGPQHVESLWARDRTRVPRLSRWLLKSWIPREVHRRLLSVPARGSSLPVSLLSSTLGSLGRPK